MNCVVVLRMYLLFVHFTNGFVVGKSEKDSKQRWALLFYGLPRGLEHTIKSIRQHILKPLINNNISFDVFSHSYRYKGHYHNLRNNETDVKLDHYALSHKLDITLSVVENQDAFDKTFNITSYIRKGDPYMKALIQKNILNTTNTDDKDVHKSILNIIRAYHAQSQLDIMVRSYMNTFGVAYTNAILLRPDVLYLDSLDIEQILNTQPRAVYIPYWGHFNGLNDRFMFGDFDTISLMMRKGDGLQRYSKQKAVLSEQYLLYYIEHLQPAIRVFAISIHFLRVRTDGSTAPRDDPVLEMFKKSASMKLPIQILPAITDGVDIQTLTVIRSELRSSKMRKSLNITPSTKAK